MKNYIIYVTEEIAKKAIEKGFEPIMASNPSYSPDKIPMTPTAEQICGWMREEKNLIVTPMIGEGSTWWYGNISTIKNKKHMNVCNTFSQDTYEKALLEGIDMALDLI